MAEIDNPWFSVQNGNPFEQPPPQICSGLSPVKSLDQTKLGLGQAVWPRKRHKRTPLIRFIRSAQRMESNEKVLPGPHEESNSTFGTFRGKCHNDRLHR